MEEKKNTFGDYKFDDWVPVQVQESITKFWGCFGRNYKDWLESSKGYVNETCVHGPGPNGFKLPPYGATVEYIFRDYKLSKEKGYEVFKIVRGRFIHAWNNMGRLIDEYGETHYPSSCDRWVRILTPTKEQ